MLVDEEFWDLVPDVEGHKMKGGQEAANRNLDWRVGTSNTAARCPRFAQRAVLVELGFGPIREHATCNKHLKLEF
jgi:hypothetical protein